MTGPIDQIETAFEKINIPLEVHYKSGQREAAQEYVDRLRAIGTQVDIEGQ